MPWDREESQDAGRLDSRQSGERGCHRAVGIALVLKDMAEIRQTYSGVLHLFLASRGRLACVSLQASV